MAQYNGYVEVPHDSYDEWRNATLGNGYNVDYAYGDQCWDFCSLLYWQYDLVLFTKAGGGGACDCWNISRQANSQPPFESLTGKANIKRGDILVFDRNPISSVGHITFADQDYTGDDTLMCLGQNQVGNGSGYPVTVNNYAWCLPYFLGIFRNTNWSASPSPTPSSETTKKRKFPWAVALNHWYYKHK